MDKRYHPGQIQHYNTHTSAHDAYVLQRLTNSHIVITGYEDENQNLNTPEEVDYKDMDHAFIIEVSFLLRQSIYNQPGCRCCGETGIRKE